MLTLICQRCGNPAAHRVVLYTRKFTLFFVPLFPVSRSRSMTCTFCGRATSLTTEQADDLVAGSQAPHGPQTTRLSPSHNPNSQASDLDGPGTR